MRAMNLSFSIYGILGAIAGVFLMRSVWGAFIGYSVGSMFDFVQRGSAGNRSSSGATGRGNSSYSNQGNYRYTGFSGGAGYAVQEEFSKSLLILSAEVMKADGKILKQELDYVKQFLNQQFPGDRALQYTRQLRDVLKGQHNIQQTCANINRFMPPQQRTILLQYLFGIAQSDGHVSSSEFNVIQRISQMLGIASYEFEQLKSMFWKDAADAYKALGIDKQATEIEIKKAYRKMAVQHHPDKYAQMGEEHQQAAKEKFQKIQEAYETIRKERGL